MAGTINHEASLTPLLTSASASSSYSSILRDRQKRAQEPKRTIKMLDVDQGVANRLASGMGMTGVKGRVSTFIKAKPSSTAPSEGRVLRMPRNELLDLLFGQFESKPYWSIKALQEHVKQPQVYLKEVLADIAFNVPRGPYAGLYKLKDEFVHNRGEASPVVAAKVEEGAEEDEEDDEEMVEVK